MIYRLLSGRLPEWPFEWPLKGQEKLEASRVRPELIEVLKKAIQIDPKQRYRDAVQMQAAFGKAQTHVRKQKRAKPKGSSTPGVALGGSCSGASLNVTLIPGTRYST